MQFDGEKGDVLFPSFTVRSSLGLRGVGDGGGMSVDVLLTEGMFVGALLGAGML